MIISCLREDLSNALQSVQRAISSKSMMPALSGVLLEATEDILKLHATDLEIYICKSIPVKVDEKGKVLLNGRLLNDIVRNIESEMISIEGRDGDISIKGGKYSSSLRTLPAEDFPSMPETHVEVIENLPAPRMQEAINQVVKAASKDDKRPILQGVLMEVQENVINLVSTDSYRLAVTSIEVEEKVTEEISFIIPARAMQELMRLVVKESTLKLSKTEGQVRFDVGSSIMMAREIEGKFPNWKQLIPEKQRIRIVTGKEGILSAIKRASIIGTTVVIEVVEDGISISSENREVGNSYEKLEARVEGGKIKIAFNAEFLSDGISSCSAEDIVMTMDDPEKAGVIYCENDPFKYLIMPIKL